MVPLTLNGDIHYLRHPKTEPTAIDAMPLDPSFIVEFHRLDKIPSVGLFIPTPHLQLSAELVSNSNGGAESDSSIDDVLFHYRLRLSVVRCRTTKSTSHSRALPRGAVWSAHACFGTL